MWRRGTKLLVAGRLLRTLQHIRKGYMKVKLNLTSLKGQMVRIEFRSVHMAPKPTTFCIDNTNLVAKKFGVAFGN